MPTCPICNQKYTRLRQHHWFPKRLIKKFKDTKPDIYNFLMSFVFLICKKCEAEIHPENKWFNKYTETCIEFKKLRDRKNQDDDYIIELRKNSHDLNNQMQKLQQKLSQKEAEKNGTGEITRLQTILMGKNIRISKLVKENNNIKKIEKELNRYKQIVKNMNRGGKK